MMLDYDKDVGFGKKEIIDVWCRGGGNNCSFVLSLIKFMWLSENWRNARIRILVINPHNEDKEMIISDIEKVLEEVRMDAEIKVINNQIEKRPVVELIEVESSNSDLVFLGIPDIREGFEQDYVNQVNRLCNNVGTVVLVRASSYFKNIEIGVNKGMVKQERAEYNEGDIDLVISRKIKVPEITYPDDPESALHLKNIYQAVKEMDEEVFNTLIVDLFSLNRTVYAEIVKTSNASLSELRDKSSAITDNLQWKASLSETYRTIFGNTLKIIEKQEKETFAEQMNILQSAIKLLKEKCTDIIFSSPEIIFKEISRQDLRIKKGDSWGSIMYKIRRQAFFGSVKGTKKQKVRFRKLVASHFEKQIFAELTEVFQNWGMISLQQVIKTQEVSNKVFDAYFLLNKVTPEKDIQSLIDKRIAKNNKLVEQIDRLNEVSSQTFYTLLLNKTFFIVRQISKELQEVNIKAIIKTNENLAQDRESKSVGFSGIPSKWKSNQLLLSNFSSLELMLFNFITNAKDTLFYFHHELNKLINQAYISHLNNIEAGYKHSTHILNDTITEVSTFLNEEDFKERWEQKTNTLLSQLASFVEEVTPKIDLLDRSTYDNFKDGQFTSHKASSLRARKLVEYILQQEFINPVKSVTSQTLEWYIEAIRESKAQLEEARTVVGLLKNEKVKAADLPQISKYSVFFANQLQNAEKNKLRMLNQVQERTNALMDKFSLNAITRRTNFLKKFIR
jgi:hypothetical protein